MPQSLIALQERKQTLVNEYRGLLEQTDENGMLPESAQTRAAEIKPQIENLNQQIGIAEESRSYDAELGAYRPEPTTPAQEDRENQVIGMTENEVQGYSIVRAIRALGDSRRGEISDPWAGAGLEREVQQEMVKRANEKGREVRGVIIPADIMIGGSGSERRDLTAGGANAGADFVPDILSGSLIDLLRARLVLAQAGATVMSGLNGNLYIPRQTGAVTASWVAEAGAIGESTAATDQVPLTPNAIGALTEYSRRLLLQSSQAVEAFIRNDLMATIARGIETAAFQGTGGTQPQGVEGATGTGAATVVTAGEPTFAEVVNFETLLNTSNADIGRLAYIMPGASRGHLKTTPRFTNGEAPIWSDRNTVNAYNAYASNLCTKVLFGNWADLILGFWGSMEITVDPYTKMDQALYRVVAIHETDVAIRHPESFAVEA